MGGDTPGAAPCSGDTLRFGRQRHVLRPDSRNKLGPAANAEFPIETLEMRMNRVPRDAQFFCDVRFAQIVQCSQDYFRFPTRQIQ